MATMHLITRDDDKAQRLGDRLRSDGHTVEAGPMGEALRKALLSNPPEVIVIDISRAPATGRDLGVFLRIQKPTRACLLVYLDGEDEKVQAIRQVLPDAVFTTGERLVDAIDHGLADLPSDPHVPDSAFAAYQGRSLSKKLGMKAAMRVALLNAPESAIASLAPLPEDVELMEGIEAPTDLCLWFTYAEQDLTDQLTDILTELGSAKLWILWPKKSSGVASDLSQTVVREVGLASGLVDFKVCAVDATWSGLRFTQRKGD